MNPPPSPAPLTHKLILGALLLIFLCLALLVVKVYWPGWTQRDSNPPAATVSPPDSAGNQVPDGEGVGEVDTPERPIGARRPLPTNQLAFAPARAARSSANVAPTEAATSAPQPEPLAQIIDARRTLAPVVVNQAILPPVQADPSSRATVTGMVRLIGRPPPEVPLDEVMDPMCGSLQTGQPPTTRHYVVSPEGGLANVLVFLFQQPKTGEQLRDSQWGSGQDFFAAMRANDELLGQRLAGTAVAPTTPVLIDQVECMFQPYVTAIQVGQPLLVRNSDPVLHNLHFTPRLNREFNFGQPVKGQVNQKSFDKPEAFIRLKCDVHPWMFAYVSVVAHPYFAVTDEQGVYTIPRSLNRGRYRLAAVHLKAGTIYRDVTLGSDGPTRVDLEFKIGSGPRQTSNRKVGREAIRE